MKKPKTKLKNLTVEEVSLVDAGADQQADILITKRDEEAKEPFYKRFFQKLCDGLGLDSEDVRKAVEAEGFSEKLKRREMEKARGEVWDACYALQDSISSILMDDAVEDKEGKIQDSISQFADFVKDAAGNGARANLPEG